MSWNDYCFNIGKIKKRNRAEFYNSPESIFSAALQLLEEARETLFLEFYIFSDDPVGRRFAEILRKKAAAGLDVRLIYDALGSVETSDDFFEDMRKSGVKIAQYHPLLPWKPHWNLFKRNHKKIICVDGTKAMVGGFNVNIDSAPAGMGGRRWKDSAARITGDAVADIEAEFARTWSRASSREAPPEPRKKAVEDGGSIPVELLYAGGLRNRFAIRRSYKYAIRKARRSIYITNAYFLPDRLIYRRLIKASNRGVDVKIIVPSKTDHPYVKWASLALYPGMLKNGIDIYEWKGEVLHSKTAVIDGAFVSVGSHNLDHRSLHYNLEMNVNFYDEEFAGKVEKAFSADLANCKRITLKDWKARSFLSRGASQILYLFKGLL